MSRTLCIACCICFAALGHAQTAEELVQKNLLAHGGIDKIKSIKSLRMSGRLQSGSFTAQVGRDALAPDMIRETFTVQGMTQIEAYDGVTGWKISPFEGRKDPELLGEDDLRLLVEEADFYGPLVDYQAKGNKVEYLGHDSIDGDDAFKLKVTLKNGDIFYYYLDPETYLEIRVETVRFIRGAVQEAFREMGSYKLAGGVYYPFSVQEGSKQHPGDSSKVSLDKVEVNVPIDKSLFQMPAAAKGGR
ncbi:MAG TPA: hypothetical protein VMH28_09775 [Candidatus Acidoferrales bacterium]|nr:hypothetical protein [Candidatus Acidoferrales bacterium]